MINIATRNWVEGFEELERRVAQERGPVLFFALVRRDDLILFDSWDLIVAAPWASEDIAEAIRYLVEKIQTTMDKDTPRRIARIVIFQADDPEVQAFGQQVRKEHGRVELRNTDFLGTEVSEAYAFAS